MEITDLPQVSVQERHKLPATSGIYFVLNKNSDILYVGQSKNLKRRWYNHRFRNTNWMIAYIEIPNADLQKLEISLIRKFLPQLNQHHRHSVYRVLNYKDRLLSLTKQSTNHLLVLEDK